MSGWAVKMQRRAAHLGSAVASCAHAPAPYPCRMEKVKFGVPFDQICKPDIPGPLLVLILKLNKEGPNKRDVFRAPGHQANMKKLIHFLQTGRLVNIANFSVHTISSVVKKFLRKLPDGVFGVEAEKQLFDVLLSSGESPDLKFKQEEVRRIISELPRCTQQLLVLLFGTFRAVSLSSSSASVVPSSGMSSEALGVSVAPSFFHTCVGAGRQATMDDVIRFKAATKIMKFLIDHFGTCNLFGTENYRYYSRITGRCLKIDDAWIMDFGRPPNALPLPGPISLEAEMTWLQYAALTWQPAFSIGIIPCTDDGEKWSMTHSNTFIFNLNNQLGGGHTSEDHGSTSESLNIYPEACGGENSDMLESARLSVSLEGDENFRMGANCGADVSCPESPISSIGSSSSGSRSSSNSQCRHVAAIRSSRPLEERRSSRSNINDATKSLTLLPQVRRHNSLIIPQGSGSDSNLLEEEELLLTGSFLTSSSIEP
ncbi:hypothetical protein DAPPUDRAFT_219940 [Daphnia pulex]|uniref:Rho-GAP domain-containing protein n=1 Tax=Daphnia pulex TaxID=6669 RepID=E9FRQ4_DAPPU|nr:hypothetical protein DAPPUDRAFT_219940 [Daphnia pulex]|eukprot:EFX89891.1 hypothetical protein DAPPUDRAFT_219940 [Daphnia pulex]